LFYDIMSSSNTLYDQKFEAFRKSLPTEALEELWGGSVLIPPVDGQHDYQGYCLKNIDSTRLTEEYSSLCALQGKRAFVPLAGAEDSRMNRYSDVLPSDQKFEHMFFSEDRSERPYLNANEVVGDDGQVYFLTQAPVPPAFATFWNMIYYSNVSIIVMLTNLTEKSRLKAHRYWPARQGQMEGTLPLDMYSGSTAHDERGTFDVLTDNLRIHAVSSRRVSDAIMRREWVVSLKDVEHSEHTVVQYQYLGWPDHGVPEKTDEIIRLINFTLQRGEERSEHPIVVHCSAGLGRTGTFIAAHMEASRIVNCRGDEHPFANVMLDCDCMRRVRVGTIQSAEQYQFVFRIIQDFAKYIQEQSKSKPTLDYGAAITNKPQVPKHDWSVNDSELVDPIRRRYRRGLALVGCDSDIEGHEFEIRKKLCYY